MKCCARLMAVTYALWMLLSIVCGRTHLIHELAELFWQAVMVSWMSLCFCNQLHGPVMQFLLPQSPDKRQDICTKAVCALGLYTLPLPLSRPSAEASLPVGMPSAESESMDRNICALHASGSAGSTAKAAGSPGPRT